MKKNFFLCLLSTISLSSVNNFAQNYADPDSLVRIYPYVFRLNPVNSDSINYNLAIDLLNGENYFRNSFDNYTNKIIRENLDWGIKSISIVTENEFISEIRSYLGISKNLFAMILVLIHIVKYY